VYSRQFAAFQAFAHMRRIDADAYTHAWRNILAGRRMRFTCTRTWGCLRSRGRGKLQGQHDRARVPQRNGPRRPMQRAGGAARRTRVSSYVIFRATFRVTRAHFAISAPESVLQTGSRSTSAP